MITQNSACSWLSFFTQSLGFAEESRKGQQESFSVLRTSFQDLSEWAQNWNLCKSSGKLFLIVCRQRFGELVFLNGHRPTDNWLFDFIKKGFYRSLFKNLLLMKEKRGVESSTFSFPIPTKLTFLLTMMLMNFFVI